MSDGRALVALRLRQWGSSASYWLGVLGFENGPGLGGRLYAIYFWLLAGGWIVYAWVDLLQVGVQAGRAAALAGLVALVAPVAVGLLQAALMAALMGSAGVRLSWPDRAWVVTQPLAAWWFVADSWSALVRTAVVPAVLVANILAAALAHGVGTVLPAVVPAVALTLTTISLALLPAAFARAGHRRRPALAWLMPFAWAALVVIVPAARVPGADLVAVASGAPLGGVLAPLVAWVCVPALALLAVTARLNLTWAAEDSRAQTERQSVAWLAWTDPAAARAFLAERRLATKRTRGRMPGWGGLAAPAARQLVGWLRRPGVALALIELGLKVWSGLWILFAAGTGIAWLPWFVAVLATGRRSLVGLVWGGGRSPFVDQLLPWRDVRRLWAELLVPGAVATLAALVTWQAHPARAGAWWGLATAPALTLLLLVAAAGDAAFPSWRGRLGPGLIASGLLASVLVVAAIWRSPAATALLALAVSGATVLWLEAADAEAGVDRGITPSDHPGP